MQIGVFMLARATAAAPVAAAGKAVAAAAGEAAEEEISASEEDEDGEEDGEDCGPSVLDREGWSQCISSGWIGTIGGWDGRNAGKEGGWEEKWWV